MTQKFGKGHWSSCPTEAAVVRELRMSRVFVARLGTEIIGTVRLATSKPWAIDLSYFSAVQKALYIHGLAVAPDWRKRGVGQLLMDTAKEAAVSWPANALRLDAYDHEAGAGPYYLKQGFREVGRKTYRRIPLIYYELLL
jgi:predicted N-acetyltransferase YhbS